MKIPKSIKLGGLSVGWGVGVVKAGAGIDLHPPTGDPHAPAKHRSRLILVSHGVGVLDRGSGPRPGAVPPVAGRVAAWAPGRRSVAEPRVWFSLVGIGC